VLSHFVEAAIPGQTVKELGVVNGPDIAGQSAEKKIAKRGAATIVNQNQRQRRVSSLAGRHKLYLGWVGAASEHGFLSESFRLTWW
jgi:hypothetical protein